MTATERPLTQITGIQKEILKIFTVKHSLFHSPFSHFLKSNVEKHLQSKSGCGNGWKLNSDEKKNTFVHHTELTSATKLTMLMLKLTFCSKFINT